MAETNPSRIDVIAPEHPVRSAWMPTHASVGRAAATPLTVTAAPPTTAAAIRGRLAKAGALVLIAATGLAAGCGGRAPGPVVYTSQDQVYAEPILDRFADQSAVPFTPVFDSEAVKTVGLANRLLAERARPRCDVFWSNEELRTRQLQARNVLADGADWRRFGYRSRRIVIHTNRMDRASAPASWSALTNRAFRGRIAMAYPLFGTTATHFMALRQVWGPEAWRAWCRALVDNEPMIVDGNSVVVQLVGRGEAIIGLTDSDDIAAGQRNGFPIAPMPVTADTLLIPNTAALVVGAPNPAAGRELLDYLTSPETVRALVSSGALEGETNPALTAETLQPNWDRLVADLPAATEELKSIFLRPD